MLTFQSEQLIKLVKDIFVACEVPGDEALIVAENLVETNLLGLDSHGIIRLPQYVNAILNGTGDGAITPGGRITIEKETEATALVDADYNFGQVAGVRAVEIAMIKAKKCGVSCVLVQRCNHAGRLGAFTEQVANAGMVALATCNSPIYGHWVAPFGGREGRLATNPFSFAAPTNADPIVLDMSTSAISEGKVRLLYNSGQQVPPGCIADPLGIETTDPNKFYGDTKGTIKPFGGSAGYKGTGLGLMVEILSGTLKGDLVTDETLIGNGLCFIVIDPSSFGSGRQFRHLANELIKYIKSCPPAEGSAGVSVPGELDFNVKRKRLKSGITIDENTWGEITEIAKKLKVSIPSLKLPV